MTTQENAASEIFFGRFPALSMDAGFNEWCDDLDPFTCNKSDLQALLNDSPSEYAFGFLAGIMMFRVQLAAVTGCGFEDASEGVLYEANG